jgi:hypothetical protein
LGMTEMDREKWFLDDPHKNVKSQRKNRRLCIYTDAGRSRVQVQMRWIFFLIDLILPAALALGSTQPLTEISTRNLQK